MENFKIFLTKGSSEGTTEISAYCEALQEANMINLNLICLSSVLPHNSEIINEKPVFSTEDYGKRVYVILSEIRASKPGESVCAGIGWLEGEGGTGYGMVVEIQGSNEEKVREEIKASLKERMEIGKDKYKTKMNIVTETICCKEKPVCALVSLVFNKVEGWQ